VRADDSIFCNTGVCATAGNNLATVHCAERKVDGSSGMEQWRGGRTNEPRCLNQQPPTLEIQAVLSHHRWPDVSGNWPPVQPRWLLWAEPGAVVCVAVVRKSTQGILCKVEAPAPLATNGVLVEVAVGWRLPDERVSRRIG